MKNVIKHIMAITLLLFFATSCTDVLDKASVDSFPQEVVFSDIGVAKAFLGNCYDRMGGNSSQVLGGREDLLAASTDQLLCIHRPGDNDFVKGSLSPDKLGHFGNEGRFGFLHWGGLYRNIQNVNTVLANLDKVPVSGASDVALIERMKGEAYFIRAYDYTQLLRGYGGVVLNDKPFMLGQEFLTLTRSTIAQTKDFILADIAQALTLLPANMEQGRASRAACAALKSRLLTFCASELMNGGYEAANTLVSFPAGQRTALLTAARDAAKLVMDGTYGTFTLTGNTGDPAPMTDLLIKSYADNFNAIFNQRGKWNTETIWGIQYPITGGNVFRPNLWWGPNGYHNWGNNDPVEMAVRTFEMADGTPFQWDVYTPGNQALRTATAAELAADPKRNPYYFRDPRFYATVLYHGAPWQDRPADAAAFDPLNKIQTGHFYTAAGVKTADGVDTRSGLIEKWNATKVGYYMKKYLDPATVGQYFQNTNTWVEFRYSEVLLDYAEACIELGTPADLTNGLNALNTVRNRAGLPDRSLASTQVQARAFLRQERAIEFFGEDQRWYDIRRWMIAPSVIVNACEMKIKQFDNGNWEWFYDVNAKADTRSFNTKNYWLPISRDESNKAPQVLQNPNY